MGTNREREKSGSTGRWNSLPLQRFECGEVERVTKMQKGKIKNKE